MSNLVVGSSLKEFFKLILEDVISRHRVTLAEITEHYVVNLLAEFAAVEKLFDEELEGRKGHEPLALLYHRALQQDRDQKIRTLRRIGDVALYKAGFFAGSLREGVVGPDYYIQMGGAAYGQVASLSAPGFTTVYQELEQKFRALVEVLEEIAARGLAASGAQGAMKVYESWSRTGSGRLEQVLLDAGVFPVKGLLPN